MFRGILAGCQAREDDVRFFMESAGKIAYTLFLRDKPCLPSGCRGASAADAA